MELHKSREGPSRSVSLTSRCSGGECIQSALNCLKFDMACSQVTQDCILNNLRENEHKTSEEDNEPHQGRSADTIKDLKQLMPAVKAERLIHKTRDTIDELTPLPSFLDETSATGMKEIGNDLMSLWADAKKMNEIMDHIKVLYIRKDALTARR